jgi:hypothetical protein
VVGIEHLARRVRRELGVAERDVVECMPLEQHEAGLQIDLL